MMWIGMGLGWVGRWWRWVNWHGNAFYFHRVGHDLATSSVRELHDQRSALDGERPEILPSQAVG